MLRTSQCLSLLFCWTHERWSLSAASGCVTALTPNTILHICFWQSVRFPLKHVPCLKKKKNLMINLQSEPEQYQTTRGMKLCVRWCSHSGFLERLLLQIIYSTDNQIETLTCAVKRPQDQTGNSHPGQWSETTELPGDDIQTTQLHTVRSVKTESRNLDAMIILVSWKQKWNLPHFCSAV